MDIEALPGWLAVAGVARSAVRVGAPPPADDPAWCVRAAAGPDGSAGWEIFWAEAGERYAWTWFDDEATACFALFGRLAWARLVRDAAGAGR